MRNAAVTSLKYETIEGGSVALCAVVLLPLAWHCADGFAGAGIIIVTEAQQGSQCNSSV